MATFVLVHGGWGGSFGWHLVSPVLRRAGHDVYTPSLTGLGERAHLASPELNVSSHVTDLYNALYFEDLSNIVLVGHSYGGMVITGVLDQAADRVAHLVYLDAFLPNDGQSLDDLFGQEVSAQGQGGFVLPRPWKATPDEKEAAWIDERRRPHPSRCFSEPIHLAKPLEEHLFTRTYIKATADERENAQESRSAFWQAADRVRNNSKWRYREITSAHGVPYEKPVELADLLLDVLT